MILRVLALAMILMGCTEECATLTELQYVALPGGRAAVESTATPGETNVMVHTTGPNPTLIVFDSNWSVGATARFVPTAIATSRRSDAAIALARDRVELRSAVTLALMDSHQLDVDFGPSPDGLLAPTGTGWVLVERRTGVVAQLQNGPLRVIEVGALKRSSSLGIAFDIVTGTLVSIGRTWVECFDLERMESAGVLVSSVDLTSVCATQGVAWVGTQEGVLLSVSLGDRQSSELPFADKCHSTLVARSASGKTLATVAVPNDMDMPLVCAVFSVDGGELVKIAECRTARIPVGHLTVLEKRRQLILATSSPEYAVAVWSYRK